MKTDFIERDSKKKTLRGSPDPGGKEACELGFGTKSFAGPYKESSQLCVFGVVIYSY
jgi:hypothetical protein